MDKRVKRGCGVAIGIAVLVLAVILAVLLLLANRWSMVREEAKVEQQRLQALEDRWAVDEEDGTLVLKDGEWPRFGPLGEGEVLTRERYVATMVDEEATSLAREAAVDSFHGATVDWEMVVDEVEQREGSLVASLGFPYRVQLGESGWRGSELKVWTVFRPEERETLLTLRRGDVVRVGGTLAISDSGKVEIEGARLLAASE